MNNLENLLRKQYEGTITSAELEELNLLTHRKQVIDKAEQRAKVIVRRRTAAVATFCALVLVSGALLIPSHQLDKMPSGSLIANTHVPSVSAQETTPPSTLSSEKEEHRLARDVQIEATIQHVQHSDTTPATSFVEEPVQSIEELAPEVLPSVEPIVACNSQCTPDSVINDIWKFLRA